MKVSIVHPFLVERTLMKHKITTRPNQPLLFFFFVETGSRRSSERSEAHHSNQPPSAAIQNEERTPNKRLQEILGSSPSAVGTIELEQPLASSCPVAADRRTSNTEVPESKPNKDKDKDRRTKTTTDNGQRWTPVQGELPDPTPAPEHRSEERRVGKEC